MKSSTRRPIGTVLIAFSLLLLTCGATQQLEQKQSEVGDDQFYNNLGAAYYQKGQLDKAMGALKKAIELNPNNKTARSNLGNVYIDLKMYDEAIAEHKKVIDLDPNNANAFANLGVAFSQKGDVVEGMNQFKKALSINPYHPLARKNLGYTYYRMKRWPEAIDELLIARDLDEWFPGVEEGLKMIFDEAFPELKKWVNDKPMEPMSHYYLGYAYLYKEESDRALKEIDRAIELDSSKGLFYKAKGNIYFNQKKYRDAVAAYGRCVVVDPSSWTCYADSGEISAFVLGKRKEGLEAVEKASTINPQVISVQCKLGAVYAESGELEKAVAAFQKALSLGANNGIIYFNLGACYYNLKQYDMAWRYVRIAERMGNREVKDLIKMLNQVSKEPK